MSNAVVVDALRKAGFSEEMIPTMVGIAGAESGFDPKAHNPNAGTGDNSYGLFQINMLGGMGPERREMFGIGDNTELFDPYKNAQAAKKIYDLQGLGAWSVYRSGAYKNHLPTGAALEQQPGAAPLDVKQDGAVSLPKSSAGDINIYFDKPETEKKKSLADKMADSFKTSIISQMFNNILNKDPLQP